MENRYGHFGEHFMLDGYGGDPDRLNSKELVLSSLHELPDLLGMKKLAEPEVYLAPPMTEKDQGGWSGFVVVAESHVSIHTFPKKGFVSIDAYTCKNGLDTRYIRKFFVDRFKLGETEENFVIRGKRFGELGSSPK